MVFRNLQYIFGTILIIILLYNMSLRGNRKNGREPVLDKRISTLILGGFLSLFWFFSIAGERFSLHPAVLIVPACITAAGMILFRHRIFIFHSRCSKCGVRLHIRKILFGNDCICETCSGSPKRVEDIDWSTWKSTEEAVLCFIEEDSRLLLMHKKTGLGKGKINAPGGRIEAGETPEEAAIRETIEEVGMTPSNCRDMGTLAFQFTNGYGLFVYVFFASEYSGIPVETEEADPFWCGKDDIPYDKMWADDREWLPLVLEGSRVRGRFIFDDDTMLSKQVEILEESS